VLPELMQTGPKKKKKNAEISYVLGREEYSGQYNLKCITDFK
jgi:hypothetical protein